MNEHSADRPMSFEAFHSRRARFFDRMAADALLHQIETGSGGSHRRPKEHRVTPMVVEGQLSIIVEERRLIMGYFSPGQRDLADVVRHELAVEAEAFGVVNAGDVRITIEFVPPAADAAAEEEH